MFSTTKKILTNKSLMKRILFTVGALLLFKFALYIQIPMIDKIWLPVSSNYAGSWIPEGSVLEILNSFTGGALQSLSVVALGVGPYITASIVVQLLQLDIVPAFKRWSEEGEKGKQSINQATRYIAICLAFVQALAMTIVFRDAIFELEQVTALEYTYLALLITTGTLFLLWLGDQITKKGIGNGVSMIIVAGIIMTFPTMFLELAQKYLYAADANFRSFMNFGMITLIFLIVIVAVVFMQEAVRKVPIQYSNRAASSDSNVPIKINSAGVIPVIFAVTILTIPSLVIQFFPAVGIGVNDGVAFWLEEMFNYQRPIGYIIYIFLIFIFAIFYSFMQVNPEKIATNLQKQNAFIPGIRPGEETSQYLSKVLFKITLLGALYLSIIASMPLFLAILLDLPTSVQIGGTSLLIVVGVAVETARQIETELSEKTYKGFLR